MRLRSSFDSKNCTEVINVLPSQRKTYVQFSAGEEFSSRTPRCHLPTSGALEMVTLGP